MSQIKGIIEAVSCKERPKHPKYGISYQVSVKIGDNWYGGFNKKDAASLGLEKGRLVSFTAVESGDFLNIDFKTLEVSKTAAPAATGGKSGGGYNDNVIGQKIGHAITNAVALAVAAGKTDSATIEKYAEVILKLSKKLNGRFSEITADEPEADSEQEEEKPAAKPKATKPKAAAKAATPDPDPANGDPFDDDDIQF